jgi:dihydrofolate reductase
VRRLAVVEFVTLDGVMQGFHAADPEIDPGFPYGGWGPPYLDESQTESAVASLPETTAYLFGRRTYELMSRFWPHQPDDNPMAAHLNRTPKHVATRTLTRLSWRNARILDGPLDAAVTALKSSGDGKVVVLGSGELVRQLAEAGPVDE